MGMSISDYLGVGERRFSSTLVIKMPAIVLERPKLSRPMWKALKTHIIRERQRKKQEQEADAEVERQRREREDQQKEQEMTLEETKEQVAQSESRLSQLKEDKHQLFLQLKKVLNEDDTRKKIKESNFNDMMLIHGYPTGPPISMHPHGPPLYLHSVAQPRPIYGKNAKEDHMTNVQPPPSLYTPTISLVPPPSHQSQGPAPQKRSRSPSPPPQQLYHPYKPQTPSPFNPKSVGNPYGGSPAAPGSIFYTHSVSVSAAHSATAGYSLGSMYSYPSGHSSASRPSYPSQGPSVPKDEGPIPKHHPPPPGMYLSHGPSPQMPPRSERPSELGFRGPADGLPLPIGGHMARNTAPPMSQGYLQSMEHLMGKSSSAYGAPPDQEKFYLSSHGPPGQAPGSSVGGSNPSASGLRPHVTLLAPITGPGGSSHPCGIPIQQSSHGKSGSITSGHPLRPPPTTSYHTSVSVSHTQSPRLLYTQSGGQPPPPAQPSARYPYGNPNQRDV